MGKISGGSAVKIDSIILEEVEEFINQKDNKLKYVSRKQFIDLAVYEKLKKEKQVKDGR